MTMKRPKPYTDYPNNPEYVVLLNLAHWCVENDTCYLPEGVADYLQSMADTEGRPARLAFLRDCPDDILEQLHQVTKAFAHHRLNPEDFAEAFANIEGGANYWNNGTKGVPRYTLPPERF